MAQVSIRLNGYVYSVGCKDGEEAHLHEMARQVEGWVQRARALGGAAGEAKTLMMAALLMADEIFELRRHEARDAAGEPEELAWARKALAEVASRREGLERVAERAEHLAGALENADPALPPGED